MVDQLLGGGPALLALAEPAQFQGTGLPAGADVLNEVVVGDLVPLLRMVPEPSRVLDELCVVVDQHVVDGKHLQSEQRVLQCLSSNPNRRWLRASTS